MTEGKLLEFFSDIGISLSAGQLSNLLIKKQEDFHKEKTEILRAGLESSPWQHFDQTHARVGGQNYNCNVVCNPLYTVYHTTQKKDRLTVLDALLSGRERQYLLNTEAFELLELWHMPLKITTQIKHLPQEVQLAEANFLELLSTQLPGLGVQQRSRVLEATAIAAYHRQTEWPVVQVLVCDDAPQFKLLTTDIALCWVHDGRHYKKLRPVVAYHQKLLDEFLDKYWDYYRQLLSYREKPSPELAIVLRKRFHELFSTTTGYWDLDERIRRTLEKKADRVVGAGASRIAIALGTLPNWGRGQWCCDAILVMALKQRKALKLGIHFCHWWQPPASWVSASLNMCAIASAS